MEVRLRGRFRVVKDGRVVREGTNLVVKTGRELVAERVLGNAQASPSHMAIGDSNAPVVDSQTTLQGTELARSAFSSSSRTGNELIYSASFTNGGASAWNVQEGGVFNAATAGTMLSRFIFAAVTVDVGESISIDYVLTFDSA